ncbi:hypothetical protein HALLA_08645 [Halostagnicola larsenii XH-48]|uniref:Uncharacterized protein n=1 Tax=Halostagnicola larsenii XH-48 TaxID=797299 RepID=W0JUA3_9EURY|nr:hypothetical protein HALLA_08645 [Halostagnicola larsenii XH-48]
MPTTIGTSHWRHTSYFRHTDRTHPTHESKTTAKPDLRGEKTTENATHSRIEGSKRRNTIAFPDPKIKQYLSTMIRVK